MNDQTDDYRNTLIRAEQAVGSGFDKTLITLSGGALGLTITFIKDIVGEKDIVCPSLALSSWILWALSLTSLLAAFYFGTQAYRHAIVKLDEGKLDNKNPGGIFSTMTNIFNAIGALSFIVGVIIFIIFTYKNIGG